ncbi:MAG: NAD(+) kinase, partial [Candidatus Competibacteraceae bacterium]|nr:NAD(+) kinase [Candidatus Competibacteraceae bacterium]
MPYIFNTIGLIGKYNNTAGAETLEQISNWLRHHGLGILLDQDTARLLPPNGLETADRRTLGQRSDLIIVVGGDGTLLNAARSLVDFQVPILGVNLGRLGFLADVSPQEIPCRLEEVLAGRFWEEERSLLHADVIRDGRSVAQSDALNDVVVHKRDMARMIEVEAYLDGQFLNAYRADGLIISTPTGSTAYALSGGGPILHPSLEAVVLVPICPHTLTHRPIVVGTDAEIEVLVPASNTTHIQLTCDGQISQAILPGD